MELFGMERISRHIFRITTPLHVCMYLVEGEQRDLLIDTGMGAGDLKGFVDLHARHPYDVLLTHGHCDHAGGAVQFSNVYLAQADWALAKTHATLAHRLDDVFHGPFGAPSGVRESDFVPQRTVGYLPLPAQMSFDLGGVQVELIPVRGHTQGIVVPLVRTDGVVILGDAVGENTLMHFPESASVEEYRQALVGLSGFEDAFSDCLRFHGSCVSRKKIVRDMIALCDDILNGRDAAIPTEMMGFAGLQARPKDHPGVEGNLIYDPGKIRRKA